MDFHFIIFLLCELYMLGWCALCVWYIFMILYDNTKQNSGNGAHWNFPWACLIIDAISIKKKLLMLEWHEMSMFIPHIGF
jgi:hypothetical protein